MKLQQLSFLSSSLYLYTFLQRKLLLLIVYLGCIAFPSLVNASNLTDLQFASLPGGQVEITLSFDNAPPDPKGYTIESPARIALDLFGVDSLLKEKYHNLGVGNARSVTVIGANGRTRVIINLTELVSYTTSARGNDLIVTVGKTANEKALAQTDVSEQSTHMSGVSSQGNQKGKAQSSIEEVDFKRGPDGDGQVMVRLSDPNASVDMSEQGGKIIVQFMGVELPEKLRRRLDVVDFATPVQTIDAMVEEGNAVIQIKPDGYYEYLAYQADENFTISVKPITEEDLEKRNKDKFIFTGEKLSLNFQDIEVRSVLQLIADFTGLNLVASDTVSGRITLRLQNVPWDQALDLILKTKGLDKRKVGNVMLVAPADEIAAREKLELETTRQVEELAPLRTEFIQVNYAKASDLSVLISGTNGAGMLSSRGSITVDERTNTLLLQDTVNKIEEIRRMLSKLDIPVKQVLIEARVVVANSDFDKELGIRWGGVTRNYNTQITRVDGTTGPAADYITGGSSNTLWDVQSAIATGENIEITRPDNLVVDLGVNNTQATSFALGYFNDDIGFLELELSALESDGKADIIATPKVLTADQQAARIASGTEIPYQEASSSGATSVSFKEAVLSLEVTPQITPDGRIIMELQVNQDTVGQIFNNVPSIDTNQIETSVLVDDGETVVLGGVFRTESIDSVIKAPFFGDLPVVGRLFKKTIRSDQKQELLVFITPKIVKGVLAQQ